jgi:hypothetical protein
MWISTEPTPWVDGDLLEERDSSTTLWRLLPGSVSYYWTRGEDYPQSSYQATKNFEIDVDLRPRGEGFDNALPVAAVINLLLFASLWHVLGASFSSLSGGFVSGALSTVLLVGSSLFSLYAVRPGEYVLRRRILRPVRWITGASGAFAGATALAFGLARPEAAKVAMVFGTFCAMLAAVIVSLFTVMGWFDRLGIRRTTLMTRDLKKMPAVTVRRRVAGIVCWTSVLLVWAGLFWRAPEMRAAFATLPDALAAIGRWFQSLVA